MTIAALEWRERTVDGLGHAWSGGLARLVHQRPRARTTGSADPRSRPVHEALARISLRGAIGEPLLTLPGTLGTLLPISLHSDVYARMIADAQRDRLHRYYRIVGGDHVNSLMHLDPQHLRPMLPCFRTAFDALTAWVEDGQEPPRSGTVPRPAGSGATDPALLNSCS